jgi:4-amino-4-deoxy-L-arabinose transferase-like glycosyltransferase
VAVDYLLALFIFGVVLVIGGQRASLPGPYRIDEAHKVGETYFLLLALRGDFSHPDWFREIEQRTNPPVGKYLFGLSALLHGAKIPAELQMAHAGLESVQPPPDLGRRYLPALVAARRVSVVATALTAIVLYLAARLLSGLGASLLAVALYLGNFLTQAFLATAVFDPLLTLFVTLTVLPLLPVWKDSRRDFWWCCLAGTIAALAFQVRASGLIALAAVVLALIVLSLRRKSARPLLLAMAATATCLVVATIINPFYWAVPDDVILAEMLESDELLPLRVVKRYGIQIQDQQRILAEAQRRGGALRPAERPRFIAEMALADWAGMLSLIGLLLGLFLLARSPKGKRLLPACAWGLPIILLTVLLLPLPWPRYVLVLVPPLALIGALGWAELLGQTIDALRSRREL